MYHVFNNLKQIIRKRFSDFEDIAFTCPHQCKTNTPKECFAFQRGQFYLTTTFFVAALIFVAFFCSFFGYYI